MFAIFEMVMWASMHILYAEGWVDRQILTNLLTYLLTYLLHAAESFLRS